jgi:hypothetical protein
MQDTASRNRVSNLGRGLWARLRLWVDRGVELGDAQKVTWVHEALVGKCQQSASMLCVGLVDRFNRRVR